MGDAFLNVLERYTKGTEFLLHDFAIMHDHVHLLLTPSGALERAVQLIKGGYSFRAKRSFDWHQTIWQPGFTDHRIHDADDMDQHHAYIAKNVDSLRREEYPFCGRGGRLVLAPAPQWLKPLQA